MVLDVFIFCWLTHTPGPKQIQYPLLRHPCYFLFLAPPRDIFLNSSESLYILMLNNLAKLFIKSEPFFHKSTCKPPDLTNRRLGQAVGTFGIPYLLGKVKFKLLPSGKLTWQWKMDLLKMYSLLNMGIFPPAMLVYWRVFHGPKWLSKSLIQFALS